LKLRLFYCLHLPGVVLPGELDHMNRPHFEDEVDGPNAEEACDAEEFFDAANDGLNQMIDQLKDGQDETPAAVIRDPPKKISSVDATSLGSLHKRLFLMEKSAKLPVLPRDNFVHLWKNLHDLIEFGNLKDTTEEGRQQMYHAISVVGTLLLQIGEVGQKVRDKQAFLRARSIECDDIEGAEIMASESRTGPPKSMSSYDLKSMRGTKSEEEFCDKGSFIEWSVNFEQFMASIMNEGCLVDFFDHKVDVVAKLKKLGATELKRQESIQISTGSKSVFYA